VTVFAAIGKWFIGTKFGRWIVGIALALAALAMGALVMFRKGEQTQADKDVAKDAQSLADAAQEVVNAANVRKDVENETAKLPDAQPQPVATADAATAAGKLRDGGWLRDDSTTDGH